MSDHISGEKSVAYFSHYDIALQWHIKNNNCASQSSSFEQHFAISLSKFTQSLSQNTNWIAISVAVAIGRTNGRDKKLNHNGNTQLIIVKFPFNLAAIAAM